MDTIEIICPIHNASEYILDLNNSIKKQRKIKIIRVNYLLTKSNDNTEQILIDNKIKYKNISTFSHSLTREKAVFNSTADYAIMISQDIKIDDNLCFYKLYSFIKINNLGICYGRQKSNSGLDKYYRMISYGKDSYVYSNKSLQELGINACFCSDSFAVYNVKLFKKINGYDNKDLNTNEDMYYAFKLLSNNYKVGYCSEAIVGHTHKLKIKKLYKRYYEIGRFFKNNPELNNYKNNTLKKYLNIVIKILKDFKIHLLILLPIDVITRIKGLRDGYKYDNKK